MKFLNYVLIAAGAVVLLIGIFFRFGDSDSNRVVVPDDSGNNEINDPVKPDVKITP